MILLETHALPSQLTLSRDTQTHSCMCLYAHTDTLFCDGNCQLPACFRWLKAKRKYSLTIYTIQLHVVFSWFLPLIYLSDKVTMLITHTRLLLRQELNYLMILFSMFTANDSSRGESSRCFLSPWKYLFNVRMIFQLIFEGMQNTQLSLEQAIFILTY